MENNTIKFGRPLHTPFYKEVKEKTDNYFISKGYGKKANRAMILKMVIIAFLFFGSYAALLSNRFSEQTLLLLALLFGLSQALIAFNISHDASHNALFSNSKLNKLFSYSFNLIGVNRYIWDIKHNVSHHSFTNVPGYDMDIEQIKIARLVNHVKLKWFYRYQHIYVPLLYPVTSLYMIFIKDFQLFATKKFGNNNFYNHPKKEYLILFVSKLVYFTYALVIPLVFINLVCWKILIGFFLMHFVLGVFLAIIFFPVHALDDSPFPEPDNGIIDNSWAVHQVEVTTNFGVNNKILFWLSGGLNTHIAHHLFSSVCHIHYFDLTQIIRATALKHNIRFRENTIFQALSSHINLLKIMGRTEKLAGKI
ncbi:MAG: acyl-CoA desaturase [Bacteroidetes bacterium]|nr:acyl-CoA desaturase [Bacteroidota bacterium]